MTAGETMCGIIGYTGSKDAKGKLIKGLKILEYRGYDSAGIALARKNNPEIIKCKGRIEALEKICADAEESLCGIGHTRWATHGDVSDVNSHPHAFGRVTLVHNGIIENYKELIGKYDLNGKLRSQTDSEVIAAIIDQNYRDDPYTAITETIKELKGTFALAIMFDDIKDTLFAVRNVSPIVMCKNDDGVYLASDTAAISEYSGEYIVLPENTVAQLKKDSILLKDFSGNKIEPKISVLDFSQKKADKGDHPFFMEKEICEQPKVFAETIKYRIKDGLPDFFSDHIDDDLFKNISSLAVAACGTAMHAGLIGKHLIEDKVRIPCPVYLASEFTYSNPIISEKTLLICVSQSGETIDTLEALKYARSKGAKTLSIVNVKGSSIARESDFVIYTDAGPETAVASTKAYTTQLAVFYLITAKLALEKGTMSEKEIKKFISGVTQMPEAIENILSRKNEIRLLAKKLTGAKDVFMIGRGADYYTLTEASLKLKEISYIHSESFASGELKHGTIALITDQTPVIALVTQSKLKAKEISNIKEVQSRCADVMTFIRKSLNDDTIACSFELPDTEDEFAVVPAVVSLQLLAYYVAFDKGLDVDKPRNLAKVVTVE